MELKAFFKLLNYTVVECMIHLKRATMIIDRKVSTDIMLILIVTFD